MSNKLMHSGRDGIPSLPIFYSYDIYGDDKMDLASEIILEVVFLFSWILPTLFVLRCFSINSSNLESISYRVTRFGDTNPILLPILESIPCLILLVIFLPISELLPISLFPAFSAMTFLRLVLAWRSKKYPA